MIRSFAELFRYVADVWRRVSVNQKIAIILVAVVLGAALYFWSQYAGQPDYGLLYKGLSQQDAAEIVSSLSAKKVSVELADNGSSVLVPAAQVHKLRLELASQGLPHGTVGYSIFDQKSLIGMSDFVQHVNMIRAVQGELEKTISSLSNVEWARVLIAKPKDELFLNDQKKTTASVVLKMRGGQQPSQLEITGIAHLVAASVEGLEPANITITDDRGRPLLKPRDDSETAELSQQMDVQKGIEQYLSSKVTRLLEAVLGPGKAIASVTVEVDHTRTSQRTTTYTQASQFPSSESETSTTTSEKGTGGREVNANPDAGNAATPASPPATTISKESRVDYHKPMPMNETTTAKPGGEIRRLTAAVFVEGGSWEVKTGADGKTTRTYKPATDVTKYEAIVKEAIGFKQDRDTVMVNDRAFWQPEPVEAEPSVDIVAQIQKELTPLALKHGPVVLLLAVFVFFARRALKKMEKLELPLTVGTTAGQAAELTAGQPGAAAPGQPATTGPQVDAAATSQALRSWMRE